MVKLSQAPQYTFPLRLAVYHEIHRRRSRVGTKLGNSYIISTVRDLAYSLVCSRSHTTLTSANSSVQFDSSINVPSHGSNWSTHTYSSFNGVSSLNYSTANETRIASTSCANASIPSHILLRSRSVWAPSPSRLSGPWNALSDILAPYSGNHQTCSGTLPHNQDILLMLIGCHVAYVSASGEGPQGI